MIWFGFFGLMLVMPSVLPRHFFSTKPSCYQPVQRKSDFGVKLSCFMKFLLFLVWLWITFACLCFRFFFSVWLVSLYHHQPFQISILLLLHLLFSSIETCKDNSKSPKHLSCACLFHLHVNCCKPQSVQCHSALTPRFFSEPLLVLMNFLTSLNWQSPGTGGM